MPKDTAFEKALPRVRKRLREGVSLPTLVGAGGGKSGGGPPVESANTLQTNAILRLIEVLSEGPIKGVRQVYLNETPLTDENDEPNFEGVEIDYRLGLPSQAPVPGFSSQEADFIVDALVEKATPVIQTITDALTDSARVTIKIPALFEYKDNGDMVGAGVSYAIEYRPSGGAWTHITGSPFNLVNEKNTAPVFLPYRFPLTGNAPWDVRVTRVTDDTTDNTKLQNAMYFFALSQILEQKFTYPNTAYMAVRASAQQFGEQVPSRAALVDGLICRVPTNFNPLTRTYTGIWNGTFKQEWTDCPAWCSFEMITNERFGLGDFIDTSMLDATTLYSISQYCAQQVDNGQGGTEPRFTFNAYIGTRQEAFDLLNAMVSVFRGMIYWSLGTAMFAHDAPKDPILTVTRANTVNGDFSYAGASILAVHNRINVTYNNPENFYKRDVVTVDDPAHIAKHGLRPADIIAFGCTSRAQAIRAGRWLMYTERMESDVLTYVAGQDHVDAVPGAVIRVMDPSVMGVGMGGRVSAYTSTTLTLDRTVTLESGQSYELVVHDRNRALHYRTITTPSGDTDVVAVSVALPTLTENPFETVWAIRKTTGIDTLYRILSVKEVGSHQYEVTALRHDPTKYAIIENGYEIPAYPLPLLPTGPLPQPTNLIVREQVTPTSGTLDQPNLLVSLTRPSDPRVRGMELQYRRLGQQWQTIDLRANAQHTVNSAVSGDRYQFQARCYDALGGYSPYTEIFNLVVSGNPLGTGIPGPANGAVAGVLRGVEVSWLNPVIEAFKEVEVWASATSVEATATKVGASPAERFIISNLGNGVTRHVWLKTIAHGTPLRTSGLNYAGSATSRVVETADIAPGAVDLTRAGTSLIAAIDAAAGSAAGDVLAAQAARDAAIVAQNNAVTAQNAAQTAMTSAQAAFTAADAAKTAALGAQTGAQTAQGLAQTAMTDATTARNAAQAARDLALGYRDGALTAQTAATTAMNDAVTARNAAQAARDLALGYQGGAQTAQAAAAQANTDAQAALALTITARNASQLAETNAETAEAAAEAAEALATTARTAAEAAQAAALASANSASTSSTAAVSAALSAAGAYAVAGPTQLRIPADGWTNNSTTATTNLLKDAAPGAQFLTNDADFGDCYEFQGTTNLILGQAYGFQYAAGRVYDVTYRFKAVTGPCKTTFGITTQLGTTQVQANIQSGDTDFTTANGVVTRVIRFGPTGTSASGVDALVVLGTGAADRAYPHIRQNRLTTTGRLRVAQISVRDVTDMISAASSASAAATQSAAAGVSATDAAQSATAAQISRTAAETARSGAESAQTSAATSATNASSSAASAATSATNATNSANTAGSQAAAAQTSAGQAATSATNAGLSATSAQASAVSARITIMNGPILPFDFRDGLTQWTTSRTGDPATLTDPSGFVIVTDTELGQAAETSTAWNTAGPNLLTRGVAEVSPSRIYKVTITFKVFSTTASATLNLNVVARTLDSTYLGGADNLAGGGAYAQSATTIHQITRTYSSAAQTGVDQVIAGMATLPYMRFGLRSNEASKNAVVRIGMIRVEDVTESILAGNSATGAAGSATAAATSASNASVSATQAGTFASQASTSATTAATSATNAGNSATAASTSATNASTSASAAATSATTATNSANTASTQAGSAATSASQAATSASNALGSANSAATSASTAADTLTTAQRIAANLLPYDFIEDGRFWSASSSGAPGARAVLNAVWTFPTITEGKVAQITAPQASSHIVSPLAYVAVIPGNTYKVVVRARHVGAFAGSSATALRLYLRGITSTYAAGTDVATPVQTFAAPDTWYDFTTEGVVVADPFLTTFAQIRSANFGVAGPIIQIASVRVQDVTSLNAANSAASAAATSASTAAASQTAAAASASAAQTARTGAETARGGAESAQTAAASSATTASTQAAAASTSATNAANSATTAGAQATAAQTSAGSASTSATDAAQSATSAQSSLVSARLAISNAPILPHDFTMLGAYWSAGFTGSPSAIAKISDSAVVTNDTDFGNAYEATWASAGNQLAHTGVIVPQAGRVYKVVSRFKVVSTAGSVSVSLGSHIRTLDSAYAQVAADASGTQSYAPGATVYTHTRTYSSVAMAGVDTVIASLATAPFVRFGLRTNSATSTVIRIGSIRVEDVTDSVLAANSATGAATSATAASGSASTASTQATAAGVSATAAAASATTASTQAGNASTSATQAATSATNALGSANSAASSASVAADTLSVMDRLASNLLPNDFVEDGRFWTNDITGDPSARAAMNTAIWVPTTVAGVGRVLRVTAPQGSNRNLMPRGYVSATNGRRYRVTVRARHVGAFAGGSATAIQLYLRRFADYSTSAGDITNPVVTFSAIDTWQDLVVEGVMNTNDPFVSVIVQVRGATNFNTAGPVIEVQRITFQDVTAMVAAENSASAAATSASSAAASETAAGTSASAAQTARTGAETARGGAESAQTAAATSATNAAASASSASTSATNAANSATTSGNSANAAQTSAGSASTFASNAATSATAAQNSLVSARLAVISAPLLPSTFEEGLVHWTGNLGGAPGAGSDVVGTIITGDAQLGTCLEVTWNVVDIRCLSKGVVTPVAGRIYRVSLKFKVMSTTASANVELAPVVRPLDSAYSGGTTNAVGANYAPSTTTVYEVSRTYSSQAQTGVDTVIAALGTSPYARMGMRCNEASKNAVIRIGAIRIEDVTESILSANSATGAASSASAASGSASTAATHATNAGTSATAAAASATTATTQAGNASTSAAQAATSATSASGSANSAATSATTAANTLTEAQRLASSLFPSGFTEGGTFFTSSLSGAHTSRGNLAAAVTFTTVTTEGQVANITAPQAGNVIIATKGYISAVVGRRYRLIVRARHVGAFAGTSATCFRANLRRVTSAFAGGADLATINPTFAAIDTWYDFVVEGVHSGADPYLVPFCYTTNALNTAGPVIQVSRLIVQDVTEMVAAENAASAAATSATAASASQTAAASSASSAATSATNANTSAANANTSASQASTSATNAAGSASAAATSATNAANSASTAGTQATAAGTSASNASTSATNAASSATSAQQSLVSARLSIINAPVLPYDFADGKVAWTQDRTGAPGAVTDPGGTIVTDGDLGQALEISLTSSGVTQNIIPKGTITPVAGKVYRLTVKFKFHGPAAAANVSFGVLCTTMDSAYALVASSEVANSSYAQGTGAVYTITRTFSDTAMTGVDTVVASLGTAAAARFGFRRHSSSATNASTVRVGLIQVQDVTQEILAANSANGAATSASAASGSASTAATHATAAGTSATAAAASATTASTQAGNASTSASQAATSATNAAGSATSAATSATTAATTLGAVDRAAAALFISDFTEDGRFFTGSQNGAPGARADLASPWTFSTNSPEGRIASLAAPQGTARFINPKGYIAPQAGRTYKISVRARHSGAFVGSSSTALRARLRGVTSAWASGATTGTNTFTFSAIDTWQDFSVNVLHSGSDPYLCPQVWVDTSVFNGSPGPVIDVAKIIVEDVTSEVAAAGSASAASTSATAAAASQTAAGSSASAAATSATNAATQATNAAGSASAANTSAGQASTSATNAAGSASTASTYATTASNSANAAVATVAQGFPTDFTLDGQFYQTAQTGAPGAGELITGNIDFVNDTTNGRTLRFIPLTNTVAAAAHHKGVIAGVAGRRYRMTVRARKSGTVTTDQIVLRIIKLDVSYATPISVASTTTASLTTTMTNYTLEYTAVAGDTFLRFGVEKQAATAGAGDIRISSILVEDITSETAASGSASAAATSASNASTSATNAGNSATAAATSATNASTSAANANTAFVNASAAETNAAGSSAQALTYLNAAARVSGGGVSKNPVFNRWGGTNPDDVVISLGGTSSIAKITSGVRYVNALQMVGSDTTQNRPLLRLDQNLNTLDCPAAPQRVLIRAEVELISGSLATSGTALQVVWTSVTGGTNGVETKLLTDFMVNATGRVQTIEWYVERPAAFVAGTTPYIYVDLFAISNLLGASRTAATIRVHRFDFEEVTANSVAEVFQRAKVAVDGIQSAAIGLRAVAGSGGALLELVALDNPVSGAVSAARIAADNIILDGSVKTNHLEADSVTATKIAAGAIEADHLSATNIITASAQIGDAVVDTLQIAGQAVTFPQFVATGSIIDITSTSTWTTLLLEEFEYSGGNVPVLLEGQCNFVALTSGGAVPGVNDYVVYDVELRSRNLTTSGSWVGSTRTSLRTDHTNRLQAIRRLDFGSDAGTIEVELRAQRISNTGSAAMLRTLFATALFLEMKR